MEIKWLEDFICLIDTGSFSKASEERNVTQSAFSRRIIALETWLGTSLVDRKSHPIKLTEDGARFFETAIQSVRTFHKAKQDFSRRQNKHRDSLTIGIADYLAIHFFPPWLKSLGEQSPKYYFDLHSSIRSGVSFFKSLQSQEYDLLICYRGSVNPAAFGQNDFESLTLGNESLVPVWEESVLKTGRAEILPGTKDKPLPFISYKPYSSLAKEINQLTSESDVAPVFLDAVIESSSAQSIKSLALEGYGIAWLPESSVEEEIGSGKLNTTPDHRYHIPLVTEIHRYKGNRKPEVSAFWQTLQSLYSLP